MPDTYLHLAVEQCAVLLDCDDAMLYIWDEGRQRLVAKAATDRHRDFELAIELALGDGVVGWSALNREPVILTDVPAEDLRFRLVPDVDEAGHRSFIAVPLIDAGDQVQAVIVARHLDPGRFTESDVSTLQVVGDLILHDLQVSKATAVQLKHDHHIEAIQAIGQAGASDSLQVHDAVNLIANQLAEATSSPVVLIVSAQISNRPYLEARGVGVHGQANVPAIQIGQISAAAVAAAAGSDRPLQRDEAPELFATLGSRSVRSFQSVVAISMQARGLELGTVLAFRQDRTGLDHDQIEGLRRLVSQAALAIAVVDLTTDPDERRAERRLLEILFSSDHRTALMRRLANEVGFDLEGAHCVSYGRLGSDAPGLGAQIQMQTLERLIRQTFPRSLCDVQMHGVRAVIPLLGRSSSHIAAMMDTALATRPGTSLGLLGVSDPVEVADRHWDALQEAILASRLCSMLAPAPERLTSTHHGQARSHQRGLSGRRSMAIGDAGPERFLLPLVDAAPPGLLEQRLLDLHAQDMADGTDLFETVETFVEFGCRPTAAARQLGLHRNSLTSRLTAASRTLSQPIDNTNRLMIEIALKLVRLRLAS